MKTPRFWLLLALVAALAVAATACGGDDDDDDGAAAPETTGGDTGVASRSTAPRRSGSWGRSPATWPRSVRSS